MKKIAIGCVVFLALPILVLAAAAGPFRLAWVERRARQGRWGPRRDVALVPPKELWFSWMCRSDTEARDALSEAVDVLVSLLPSVLGCAAVESIAVENFRSGFAVAESRLHRQPIVSDFGRSTAQMLYGERTEDGYLIVNSQHRLPLDLDARSFVGGHFAVDLPGAPADAALEAARAAFDLRQDAKRSLRCHPTPRRSGRHKRTGAGVAAELRRR